MTRPLKFRARHHVAGNWHYGFLVERNGKTFIFEQDGGQLREYQVDPKTVSQFTGLTDKNDPPHEVYEGDIISPDGKVIGNEHENRDLLQDEANLLVQGFGTGDWIATYAEAVERGCNDAK